MLLLQSKADSTRDFSAANGLLILIYTQAVTAEGVALFTLALRQTALI